MLQAALQSFLLLEYHERKLSQAVVQVAPNDYWRSDFPDIEACIEASIQHHSPVVRARLMQVLRKLENARWLLDRLVDALPPSAEQFRPSTEPTFCVLNGAVVVPVAPPHSVWETSAAAAVLAEFATTSRYEVFDSAVADEPLDDFVLQVATEGDFEPEHIAALAAYACMKEATGDICRVACLSDECDPEDSSDEQQLAGIEDAESSLRALHAWHRSALQTSAERALQTADSALRQTQHLREAEGQRFEKRRVTNRINGKKNKPTNKHSDIEADWKKLELTRGKGDRRIATLVATRKKCTAAYVRRVAAAAGLRTIKKRNRPLA